MSCRRSFTKESFDVKYLKRVAYVFVFCLALVGVFALLKKAPQIHIPEEDKGYLEEVFCGVKFDGNGQASQGGLSSLMDHGVEGVPPVSSSLSGASAAPPSSFGSIAAPAYAASSIETSEAPAFGVAASTEAPAFGSSTAEAPAFQASNANLPELNTQRPIAATVAPQYGSQFQAPTAPVVPAVAPTSDSGLPEAPQFETTPNTQTEPVPSAFAPEPNPSPPISYTPSTVPPPWSGPATGVDSTPSSVSAEPRGDFGVSGQDVFVQNPTINTPSKVDPFSSELVSANPLSTISNDVLQTSQNIASNHSVASPKENFDGVAEFLRAEANGVTAENNSFEATEERYPRTVFVKPQLKRLPQIPESVSVVNVLPKPVEEPLRSVPEPQVAALADVVPNDYRQTSMRNTMVLAPMRRSSPDEAPKVSFAQQAPQTTPPQASISETISPQKTAELKTLVASSPEMVATETLPFVETKSEPALPKQAIPPFPVVKEIASINANSSEQPKLEPKEPSDVGLVQTMPMVPTAMTVSATSAPGENFSGPRDTVGRFIDAQSRAFESGDPERVRSAYIQLSRLYDHKELNEAERTHLRPILDRMGLEIIFSCKQHVLEPAYTVKAGDTIDSIATIYRISPALLMKINGLTGARPLKPGSSLKVVFGQFDARVSVSRNEMTLILGGLYAGRFPVTFGKEIQNLRGDFVVTQKDESFRGKVLTLNNGVTLRCDHSTENSLRFSERDANELFDILTQSSVISMEN